MKMPVFRGPLLTVACAALACSSVVSAAQPPLATGQWARAPALPTACYQGDDPFSTELQAALTAVQNDHYAQNDINSGIQQQVNDSSSEDPMEMARRLQEAMMEDPQAAQQFMQNQQNTTQQAQAEHPEISQQEQQLQEEEKTLVARYKAALATSHAPGDARWTALKKKMGIAPDSTGLGEADVPQWASQEWVVIVREWDAGDQATCAQWWVATGPMHAYMKRFKDFQIQKRIPNHLKYEDEAKLKQYEFFGIPTTGYKSTAEYEAVEAYMKLADRLFRERLNYPRCNGDSCG